MTDDDCHFGDGSECWEIRAARSWIEEHAPELSTDDEAISSLAALLRDSWATGFLGSPDGGGTE